MSPEGIEDVAFDDEPLIRKGRKGTCYMLGYTVAGRYLFVVYVLRGKGTARVVTAMDMDDKTRKLYKSKEKMMKKIPAFKTQAEEIKFWETHSIADYWNELEEGDDIFKRPKLTPVDSQIRPDRVEEDKDARKQKGNFV